MDALSAMCIIGVMNKGYINALRRCSSILGLSWCLEYCWSGAWQRS